MITVSGSVVDAVYPIIERNVEDGKRKFYAEFEAVLQKAFDEFKAKARKELEEKIRTELKVCLDRIAEIDKDRLSVFLTIKGGENNG